MTIRRFFAPPDSFDEGRVSLGPGETRHLRDVLRLKTGDEVRVFDGEGKEFLCAVQDIKRSGATLNVRAEVQPNAPESDLDLTIAAAVYKNDKLDLVIQKAVELGVVTFSPVVTLRGELKLRDALKRTDRWRKIALEATKQCERSRAMLVEEPVLLSDYLAGVDKTSGLLLIFSEKDGKPVPTRAQTRNKITALIGPKGGWEDSEIELASKKGFVPIKLGRRIMRAETAAIAFAALLQHRFGDLN